MKKKLSLLLACAMLVGSIFTGSAFADEAATPTNTAAPGATYTDVNHDTKYYDAIIELSKFGIINGYKEDNTFRPEGNITRAEFTKIVAASMGLENAVSAVAPFSDISGHWAANNIQVIAGKGIVNGFEDGTFRPDDNVTYEQAVKMIVCTLGYEQNALSIAPYPDGYLQQAASLGLVNGITGVTNSAPATRGTVAKLMNNALSIDVMNMAAVLAGQEQKTFMETYLKVIKAKGRVVGVEDSITAECSVKLLQGQTAMIINKDILVFDYTDFGTKADMEKYLGHDVRVYYRDEVNGEARKIVAVDDETQNNTVIEILSDDVDNFSGSTLRYYDKDDKTKNVSFKNDCSIIYNNVLVGDDDRDMLENWLDPSSEDFIYGKITVTKGNDNVVSMVSIMDYDVMVASRIPSTTDYKLTTKMKFANYENNIPVDADGKILGNYRQTVTLNPEAVEYTYTIKKDGKDSTVTSIRANDIVLVAESLDGEKLDVQVASQTVSGTVNSIDKTRGKIKIDNKEYYISDLCMNEENGQKIKTTSEVTAHLDSLGTIQYIEITTSTTKSPVVYLVRALYTDESEEDVMADFYFPSSNSVKRYSFDNKVHLNGASQSASEVLEYLWRTQDDTFSDGTSINNQDDEAVSGKYTVSGTEKGAQLVRITLSGDKVSAITTINPDVEAGTVSDDPTELVRYHDVGKGTKYAGSSNFDNSFYINSATTIIYVPENRTDTDKYGKRTASSFTYGTNYYVQAYNVNNSKVAEIVLLYGNSASGTEITYTTPMYLVGSEATDSYDSSLEENITEFDVYASTNTKSTRKAERNDGFDDLKVGDLIQFGTDSGYSTDMRMRIAMDDIQAVLDGQKYNGKTYDWTDSTKQDVESKTGEVIEKFNYETAEMYNSTLRVKYGRLFMANVLEVMEDGSNYSVRVTRDGFDEDGQISYDNEEKITLSASTKIVRVNTLDGEVEEATDLTALDLIEERTSGMDCSKIAVYMYGTTCKFIVIYE